MMTMKRSLALLLLLAASSSGCRERDAFAQQIFSADRYRQVVLSDNPLVYWRANEASGTTATDESRNSRNGTLNTNSGTFTYQAAGALKGNPNGALTKTATPYMKWTQSAFNLQRTSPMSVEFWLNSNSLNVAATLVNNVDPATGYIGWEFYCNSATQLSFLEYNTAGTNYFYRSAVVPSINDNAWHHIVATYDGSSTAAGARIFVDGTEGTSYTTTADSLSAGIIGGTQTMEIGQRSDFSAQLGAFTVDEFAVYDSQLSASRIGVHYNAGKNGS